MRAINEAEHPLVSYLFELASLSIDTGSLQIEPMEDGGMGSLAIAPFGNRKFGSSVAECHFYDSDGVAVSAKLNLDQSGLPLEVDVWKVDFTSVVTWPARQQILAGSPNNSFQAEAASRLGLIQVLGPTGEINVVVCLRDSAQLNRRTRLLGLVRAWCKAPRFAGIAGRSLFRVRVAPRCSSPAPRPGPLVWAVVVTRSALAPQQ